MQYGYFDDKAYEYVITRLDTHQSWSNYLDPTEYGAITTNNAGGYGFYQSGARAWDAPEPPDPRSVDVRR
ncbi:MAG: hypothetical protein IMZ73_12345 [Chloroflexi bacterium]|nr:hypothetical protein [Chloroflexota bacterium]